MILLAVLLVFMFSGVCIWNIWVYYTRLIMSKDESKVKGVLEGFYYLEENEDEDGNEVFTRVNRDTGEFLFAGFEVERERGVYQVEDGTAGLILDDIGEEYWLRRRDINGKVMFWTCREDAETEREKVAADSKKMLIAYSVGLAAMVVSMIFIMMYLGTVI